MNNFTKIRNKIIHFILYLFVLDNIESVIQFANLDESSVSASATEIKKKSKTEKDKVFKLDRKNNGRDENPAIFSVDSQSVKAAPMINQERGIDNHKRVNGRKRQTLVDTMGLVWGVLVHAANGSDSIFGAVLMIELKGVLKRVKKVLVDQGYQKEFMRVTEEQFGVKAEISSKPPSAQGFVPVKWRWVSERTFGWFNFFRRLSKDYEKTVENSEAWILWANCQINISKI